MCGRFKRRSDKQKIAEAFAVSVGLDETFFDPGDDFSPQSMQPVIYTNDDGERQIQMMHWAFRLSDNPRPLFNARSEALNTRSSGEMLSLRDVVSFPRMQFLSGRQWRRVRRNRNMSLLFQGRILSEWLPSGSFGRIRRQISGNRLAILTGEPIDNRMTTFLEPRHYEEYLSRAERPPVHLRSTFPLQCQWL
jgi:hypothetical protein